MRILGPATEDDMVLTFLRAEIGSSRFSRQLHAALAELGLDRALVEHGDPSDAHQNAARRDVLQRCRGYPDEGVFGRFPDDVAWSWVALTPDELADVRYIHWDYWLEVTGGTRRPADAIARMRHEWDVPGDDIRDIADAVGHGAALEELIVVGPPSGNSLVVLEGHLRLTALLLRPETLRPETRALLGTSPGISEWSCYGSP